MSRGRAYDAQRFALPLLVVFLVAFPKAGLKLGPLPLTFGYLLLGMTTLGCALTNLLARQYATAPRRTLIAFAATWPLQAVAILLAGLLGSTEPALTVAFLVGFVLIPAAMLCLLTPQIRKLDLDLCERVMRRCVSFAALYGIFLFAYHLKTGRFIEIPYLTVNADDVGLLESGKNIDRGGGFFKLISTYNNGNIYGVCILMLLPWYDLAQRSAMWRLLVRLSLLLTLSRTVWFGWVAYELLALVYLRPLKASTLLYVTGTLAATAVAIGYVVQSLGRGAGFLLDASLGGRSTALQQTPLDLLPQQAVDFSSEIIYVTVVSAFGLVGAVCFVGAVVTPGLMAATGGRRRDPVVRACVAGMAMLLVCGLSDGPILLIPVMALYWGLAAVALRD